MNYAARFRVSQATLQNWVNQANCKQSCAVWQLVLLRGQAKKAWPCLPHCMGPGLVYAWLLWVRNGLLQHNWRKDVVGFFFPLQPLSLLLALN